MSLFGTDVAKLKAKKNIKGLLKALYGKDENVALEASSALAEIGGKNVEASLVNGLTATTLGNRSMAAQTLVKMNYVPSTDEEKGYYAIACEDWNVCADIGEPIIPLLNKTLQAFRKYFVRQLSDRYLHFAYRSLECLASISSKPAIETLIQVAFEFYINHQIPQKARELLVGLGKPAFEETLKYFENKNLIGSGILVFGEIGDERAIPLLQNVLKKEDVYDLDNGIEYHLAAEDALEKIERRLHFDGDFAEPETSITASSERKDGKEAAATSSERKSPEGITQKPADSKRTIKLDKVIQITRWDIFQGDELVRKDANPEDVKKLILNGQITDEAKVLPSKGVDFESQERNIEGGQQHKITSTNLWDSPLLKELADPFMYNLKKTAQTVSILLTILGYLVFSGYFGSEVFGISLFKSMFLGLLFVIPFFGLASRKAFGLVVGAVCGFVFWKMTDKYLNLGDLLEFAFFVPIGLFVGYWVLQIPGGIIGIFTGLKAKRKQTSIPDEFYTKKAGTP